MTKALKGTLGRRLRKQHRLKSPASQSKMSRRLLSGCPDQSTQARFSIACSPNPFLKLPINFQIPRKMAM